jgi:hypothetical protein
MVQYPFKAVGSLVMDGAVESLKKRCIPPLPLPEGGAVSSNAHNNLLQGAAGPLPAPMLIGDAVGAQNIGNGQQGGFVISLLEMLRASTDPNDRRAVGTKLIKNLFQNAAVATGDLFKPDGEGRETLIRMITTFKEFIKDDGVIKELIKQVRELTVDELTALLLSLEELNLDGGAGKRAVQAAAHNVRQGVRDVGEAVEISSKNIVRNVFIGGVLLMSSWFLWKHIDRTWRTPGLVKATSYKNPLERLKGFFFSIPPPKKRKMIFAPELSRRLEGIAQAVKTTHAKIREGYTQYKYRNLLLLGPPGTGKTMFARMLAEQSGMDYAIMAGSSFSQYRKGEGITQMNKLFEWAYNAPSGGLILFIDEAEAFLGRREGTDIFSESYQLLTNFLDRTGERSDKIMIIIGTNHPERLDDAMKRRTDDAIELPLPAINERVDILKLYRDTLMLEPTGSAEGFIESVQQCVSDEVISAIAQKTEGLSGGELEGIINSIISDAAIQSDGLVTPPLITAVVENAIEKHRSYVQDFMHVTAG